MKIDINKYLHIIWDFNGTILDDAELCIETLYKMLKRRNLPTVTHNQYLAEFDFPIADYYTRIGFDFTCEDFDDVADEYIIAYESKMHLCRIRQGLIKALEKNRTDGRRQYVLSAAHRDILKKALTKLEIIDYYLIIFDFSS